MLEKQKMVTPTNALKGRAEPLTIDYTHYVNHSDIRTEPVKGQQKILVAMGCFWGVERLFWGIDGVITTAVGYSGGITPNPSYEEVCTGKTGHAEVVRIVFDPQRLPLETLMKHFWENHDPTQFMQQGGDIGTQYRSGIYYYTEDQKNIVERSLNAYQSLLTDGQLDSITTEVHPAGPFYFAEQYHQQYLAKNPDGYCGLGGTGICFPPELQK